MRKHIKTASRTAKTHGQAPKSDVFLAFRTESMLKSSFCRLEDLGRDLNEARNEERQWRQRLEEKEPREVH